MIGRPLPADAGVLASLAASRDRHPEHRLYCIVALIEGRGDCTTGIAIDRERELREIVGADGESIEVLEEAVGENRIRRNLAHHDDAQAVRAALEPVLGQQSDNLLGLA